MSLINKMLQDLDRRQAGPGSEGTAPPLVHAVPRETRGREWFWRTLALLMFIALAWVSWVAYQVWPRPIATDLAYQSAEEARVRQALAQTPRAKAPEPAPGESSSPAPPAAAPVAEPVRPAPAAEPSAAVPASTPEQPGAPTPPDMLRLAQSIETPILEPKRGAKAVSRASAPKVVSRSAAAEEQPKVERRDRVSTPAERAENEFRYAAAVLKLGRAAEADSHFAKALDFDASHRGARQALVVMRLEQGQLEAARQLLEEGLRLDPDQPGFAMALARIRVERKDLPGALAALDGSAAAAAEIPEFQVLRATVLQRLGRHGQAADAYRAALRLQPAVPQAWVGLGISLEALQQRRDAAEAFRQALAAGPVNPDVKAFVEQRIRALR